MNVTHLECAACGTKHEARRLHNLCSQCGKPLLVRYDLKSAAASLTKESLRHRAPDLWRYREVLPVEHDENIVTLGEGFCACHAICMQHLCPCRSSTETR